MQTSYPLDHGMTNDEIDAEVAALLGDPELRADLEQAEREIDGGNYVAIPHAEVRRILGLDVLGRDIAHD